MLEAYHKRRPKPKTIVELKEKTQHTICDSLSQEPIDEAIKRFQSQRLSVYVARATSEWRYLLYGSNVFERAKIVRFATLQC